MTINELFRVHAMDGYSPQIGHLLSMMTYVRHTTLHAVSGTSIDQLDSLWDEEGNSIGALLLHIASVERMWQIVTFEERQPNKDDLDEWGVAFHLGDVARQLIRDQPLEFYTEKLMVVRNRTLEEFKKRDDAWLYTDRTIARNQPSNNYFVWFHVFEDEISHRGQIRIMRKRLNADRSV